MAGNLKLATRNIVYDIKSIEENIDLFEAVNFNARTEAIDFIEFHIIDRLNGLLQNTGPNEQLISLKEQAQNLQHRLEEIDKELFRQLHEQISSGEYSGASFKHMVESFVGSIARSGDAGYDNLDIFINGLLSDRNLPEPEMGLSPEMVFFQKTPARVVFEMAEAATLKPGDVFVDIGSGLGQIAMLMNLIGGIKTKGLEYEPAYSNYANACASQLNLPNVRFINTDARSTDYSEGTIFFLYTPFKGSMMRDMMEILRKESMTKAIQVFTYGPCSVPVAEESWLHLANGDPENQYSLCQFINL